MFYYVYIIYNIKYDKFYIGQTNNLKRRVIEHNLGKLNYTSKYQEKWILVYKKRVSTRKEAIEYENFLKKQKKIKIFIKNFAETIFQLASPEASGLHTGGQGFKSCLVRIY